MKIKVRIKFVCETEGCEAGIDLTLLIDEGIVVVPDKIICLACDRPMLEVV